jgi:hypothetical protein
MFSKYRDRFERGDWIHKIDADEFYHVTPPRFIRERLSRGDTAVHLQWYFFRLTNSELADYESNRVDVIRDRTRPIAERRRYYKISQYAEPRMFRFRPLMQWPEDCSFPYNAGFVSRQRIPIRHYPHRDPLQLQRRFKLRAAMMRMKAAAGNHWALEDWRKEIVDQNGIAASSVGQKQGLAGESGIDTGELHYWPPGTELVEKPLQNHVPKPLQRLAQRIIHPAFLPILDRRRRTYDMNYQPTAISEEANAAIGRT